MPNSGDTPNNASALSSTYPAASRPLILVEGGIPGQEGLRILPAAPELGLESGAEDHEGGVAGDGRMCGCTQRLCAKGCSYHDSARLFRGCGVVKPAVLSIDCYFESPADGTAVLSERRGLQKSLPFSGRGAGAEEASGDTWHASSHCI